MAESRSGLRPEQIARLLSIGTEPGTPGGKPNAQMPAGDTIHEMLGAELAIDVSRSASMRAMLGQKAPALFSQRGRTIRDLLLGPSTNLDDLKALKQYAKTLVRQSATDAAKAVASTIYYAAIAAALVRHGEKITQHSDEDLDRGLALLAEKEWMAPELGQLLTQARQRRPP